MHNNERWVIAYSGPTPTASYGPQRMAEVFEAASRLAPPQRTMLVAQEGERPWWSVLTTALPPANVLAEPFDRGSGTGILAGLIAVADRAPTAEVVVVFGGLSPRRLALADETLASLSPSRPGAIIRPVGAPHGLWPLAVASAQAWLAAAEAADRPRVAALQIALGQVDSPSAALDRLYPFLTAWDFEHELLVSGDPQLIDVHVEPAPVTAVAARL